MFAIFVHAATNCEKTQILHIPYDKVYLLHQKINKIQLEITHEMKGGNFLDRPHDPLISWGGGYPKAARIPGGGTRKPTVGSLGEPASLELRPLWCLV